MKHKKNIEIFFLILMISLALNGCLKKEPIKVAFVASLTGRYSDIGISSRNAVSMAVDEWNKNGGIKGRKIELTIADDMGISDSGIVVDKKLIEEGNKFIIGHITSNMTPAVFNNKNTDVLFISPTMSSSSLSIEGDNFIRAIPPSSKQSELLAKTMFDSGIKTCFILFDSQNDLYTKDVMDNFLNYMKKLNPDFIYSIDSIFKPTVKDFSEKAKIIKKQNLMATLIITNGIDFANLAQQLKLNKYSGKLYGPRWASSKDVITHGGKSVEGAIFAAGDLSVNKPQENDHPFYENYKLRYGKKPVNFIPVFAYDAANILFEGMINASVISPVAVRNSILEIKEFNGVNESIIINNFGDAKRSISLISIKNGTFINVSEK